MIRFNTQNNELTQEPSTALVIPNNIDYYLTKTRQKSFKKNGTIDFTLSSDLLEHYKREDQSKMSNPDVKINRKTSWQIKAQQGHFFHPKEIIAFSNHVVLDKRSKTAPFQVRTHDLQLNIQQDLVISKSDVKVTADNWKINAKTMILNMKNEVHQFTQVTARYRHDKNS